MCTFCLGDNIGEISWVNTLPYLEDIISQQTYEPFGFKNLSQSLKGYEMPFYAQDITSSL